MLLRRLQLQVSDDSSVAARIFFFLIVNVCRCEEHATYNAVAEQTADEVPIVLENNLDMYAAAQNWCRRVKRHRETVQRARTRRQAPVQRAEV